MNLTVDNELRFPIQLSSDEFDALEQNLLQETNPEESIVLTTWNDAVIDGHSIYKICQNHNLPFRIVKKEFESRTDAKIWIYKKHLGRRNLNNYQRSVVALELESLYREKAKAQQGRRTDLEQNSAESFEPIETREELAKIASVSHDTIAKVKKIKEKATPEQKKLLETGEASINKVYEDITNPEIEADLKTSDAEDSEFRKRMHEANQMVAHGKHYKQILKNFIKQIESFEKQIPNITPNVTPEELNLTINRVRRLEAALVEAVEKLNKPPQEPPAPEQLPEPPASTTEATTPEPPAVQKEEEQEPEQSLPAEEKPATENLAENNKTEPVGITENNVHKLELIKRPTMSHGYIAVNGIDNPLLKDIVRGLDATSRPRLLQFINEFSIAVPRKGTQEEIASPVANVLLHSNQNIETLKKMRKFLLLASEEPFEIIPPEKRDYDGILGIIDQNNLNIVNNHQFIEAHDWVLNKYVRPPNKTITVFTTCAATKPYPNSNLSEMVNYLKTLKNADAIHWLVLSNATAPVPEELHLCFPFWAYEADIRKLRMKDRIEYVRVTAERLEKYLRKHKYDHYIAYLAKNSVQRAVLQQVQKTLEINIIYTKVVAHGEAWMRDEAQLEELVKTINSLTPS